MQNYVGSYDLFRGVFSWDSWEVAIRKKAGMVLSKTADRRGIEMGAPVELGAVHGKTKLEGKCGSQVRCSVWFWERIMEDNP